MTLRTHVLSGIKWTAGAKLAGQVVTWAITLIVMRLLSPGDYGLLAMASVFIALLLVLAEAGLGPALVQWKDFDPALLKPAFGVIIVINVALFALSFAAAPLLASFFREERLIAVVRVLAAQFIIMIATVIPEAMLTRQLQFKSLSLIELLAAVSASVVSLLLAWFGYGVWALVAGSMASRVLRAVALNVLAPLRVVPTASLKDIRRLLGFGGNVTGARLLSFVFNQADVVVVGRMLGNELLGLYSVAMHLASMPVQRVSSILNQVTFPVIARFQDDRVAIADFVRRAVRGLSLIAFPVLWGMSCTAGEIVAVVLGPKWHDAIVPLQVLALMMPVKMIVNFLPAATDALGRPDLGFQNVLLATLVMPLAFVVGARWGIDGIAFAWLVAYPPVLLFNTRRMLSIMGLRAGDLVKEILPAVGCATAMYAAVRFAAAVLSPSIDHRLTLVALIATGALTYGVLTLVANREGYRDLTGLLRRSKT
jgi:O-antigen/teichoic acid export membrane protein